MTFYNSKGKPVAYLDTDSIHIFLYNGRVAGYLSNDSIYSFNGKHLGWFENGWVCDNRGQCVFFTEDAIGSGPSKPAKHAKPAKGAKAAKPAKGAKQARPAKSAKSLSWSNLSEEDFFKQ